MSEPRSLPLAVWACAVLVAALPASAEAQASSAPKPATPSAAVAGRCADWASSAWPATTAGRVALRDDLNARREGCIEHAGYLALLGALWLETGDAAQALLWLERALLLDPESLGTQADHALALAALGESTALAELRERWRTRADVPGALQQRLEAAWARAQARGSAGVPGVAGWRWQRQLTVLNGHESNLDHSPRLSEITLSAPDGPIELPLAVPFEPRAGRAWAVEANLQGQRRSADGALWQLGVQLGGRHAPTQRETDQQQAQLALARWQQHDGWRSQWQLAVVNVSGPLADPYRAATATFGMERQWNGCWGRVGLDAELRLQRTSTVADSQTISTQAGWNCRLNNGAGLPNGWSVGAALRISADLPRNPDRPGGRQDQFTLGLRASGPVGLGVRAELALRQTWLRDRQGYSPLLENDARRLQQQQQVSLELSRPLNLPWTAGAELLLQLQALRQDSNLVLFRHRGTAAMGGLRWEW